VSKIIIPGEENRVIDPTSGISAEQALEICLVGVQRHTLELKRMAMALNTHDALIFCTMRHLENKNILTQDEFQKYMEEYKKAMSQNQQGEPDDHPSQDGDISSDEEIPEDKEEETESNVIGTPWN